MYFLRGEVRNVFTMLLDASQASSCVCPLFQFVPSCSVFSVFSVCVSGWQCEEERGYLQKTRRALHETPVSVLTDFVMSLRHTKNVYQGMASWRPPVLRRCASNVICKKNDMCVSVLHMSCECVMFSLLKHLWTFLNANCLIGNFEAGSTIGKGHGSPRLCHRVQSTTRVFSSVSLFGHQGGTSRFFPNWPARGGFKKPLKRARCLC